MEPEYEYIVYDSEGGVCARMRMTPQEASDLSDILADEYDVVRNDEEERL